MGMPITFQVDKVDPATRPLRHLLSPRQGLPREDVFGAVTQLVGGKLPEAAGRSGSGRLVITGANPFVSAVHAAWAEHRPLAISPDHIWLCIAQGFATHVNLHAEELRSRLVRHEGKLVITHQNDYTKGSAENPWPESFAFFSDEIAKHVGKVRDLVVPSFSTTGMFERIAADVALMDAMQSYFSYREMTLCGFPSITLLGTPEDWRSIGDRVLALSEYGLSWWTDALLPITDKLTQTAEGYADPTFWQGFYKQRGGSGGSRSDGWVNNLFPYMKDNVRSGMFTNERDIPKYQGVRIGGAAYPLDMYPSGLSCVPFVWDYLGTEYKMEFLAGFVGVDEGANFAVTPSLGWAVREAE